MKLDIRSEYNKLRLTLGEEGKMTFRKTEGLYESLIMLFHLINVIVSFMIFINDILA